GFGLGSAIWALATAPTPPCPPCRAPAGLSAGPESDRVGVRWAVFCAGAGAGDGAGCFEQAVPNTTARAAGVNERRLGRIRGPGDCGCLRAPPTSAAGGCGGLRLLESPRPRGGGRTGSPPSFMVAWVQRVRGSRRWAAVNQPARRF